MAEVRLRGVLCRFGEDVALRFADLEIPSGEQAVLLGPSGSGKTTLLHLLAGLRCPSAGEVWVDGRNLATLGEAQRDAYRRERVGYLFQDFYLMEGYTALENVLLGLGIAGVRGAAALRQATEILRAVGLGHRLSHPPKRLSTGERQRVALARAVAHRPRLLLADEPTAHLDRPRAGEALDLLTQTARAIGATLVVATHDPWVMERFPRRVELQPLTARAA
ncbi:MULTISPECIES: ABC transporter ATP-binding protein [unclassified Meiothermus]|uniref:ABC transporter ATP-binding protein n=1 Tax=unclassified Meiothermus TaxID=370471 RepID=UPI000D7CE92B|nr:MULTISPECIES: ABC transporter ATP-binding protein [unclassified Meiothermus]PZA07642.1 ABC transporter ATP-binding protein [Meiothermus sp. Pnk-1]RYM36479.1 ABC transporter ATP-binding protein [Meiothermus sp. PNK-Is4]